MSWNDDVFAMLDYLADLDADAAAQFHAEREPELRDRARAEYRQVTFASRLMATVGADVSLVVADVGTLVGTLERVGEDWILLTAPAQEWVLPLASLLTVTGASPRAVPQIAWSPLTKLGFGAALRRLAEEGERCVVRLQGGAQHDGVIYRVGADFIELIEGDRRTARLLPTARIVAVGSR